jgi:ribosomal protein S18 acetylase RimI-like enzyme
LKDTASFGRVLGSSTVLGPAMLSYAGSVVEDPGTSVVRALTQDDAPALQSLAGACSEEEWAHGGMDASALGWSDALASDAQTSGINDSSANIVGSFVGEELVAYAGFEVWDDAIAHLCTVTHPAFRKQGHGQSVVREAMKLSLARGLTPQYRCLESNMASLRLSARLGFSNYGFSVAARLSEG